ncbi:MAG: amidohydrolase family protein [Fimbriimonas sp.]
MLRALTLALSVVAPPPAPSQLSGQEPVAIVGARIEIGDGRFLESGTVLVENGRIAAVGPTVEVPAYAWTINGKGLTVYPGFIDAAANAPLTIPEIVLDQDTPPDTAEFAPPFMREANRKGIRPEVDAAFTYAPTLPALLPERKAGFTNLHVIPTGGILSGRGAVVDLGSRARRDSVVRADVGLGASLRRPAGTGYPNSLLGFQAQLRQAMLDGAWANATAAAERPSDAALAALATIRSQRMRLFFEADAENDIQRALDAGREFDLPVTLVGGLEAYRNASALAAAQIPVVASVAFGPEPRLPSDAPAPVREDRRARFAERVANLATLEKTGVRFALTGRGSRDREAFWRGLRQANAAGLSKPRALQALTLDAARILGVDRELGSIEVGKRGNLTIMNGDFLAPSSAVRFLLVNGELFRPDRDRLPSPPGTRPSDDEHDGHMDGDDLCEPQVKRGGGR